MISKILFIFVLLLSSLWANAYYVNNQAANGGDGSFSAPFNSIATGLNALQAGDTLYIRGSQAEPAQVYEESLGLSDSDADGTESQPIVVRNYADEKVRIITQGSFTIYTDWWTFSGLTFDINQQTNDGIRPRGRHLTFSGCTVANGQRDGFDANMADYLTIENCHIYNFNRSDQYDAHGVIINGGTGLIIRHNTIYDCKGDCIQLYKTDQNYNTLIEDNELYTTLGGGSENAIDIKATKGCTIRNNTMHGFSDSDDSDGSAIKINKDSDSLLIELNDIYDSNGGLRLTGGDVDHITITRNVIHDLHVDGGDSSKYGYGVQFDGLNDVTFTNNTFANIPGPLFWIASNGATDMVMENNIFHKANKFHGSTNDFNGSLTIDYNGWFQCQETIPGANDTYGDDPGFVDEASADYHLTDNSVCLDKGDPSFGSDFPGGRIDLGAYEHEFATGVLWPGQIPQQMRLFPNFPNPFNPETVISYQLSGISNVELAVYNMLGQKVKDLVQENQPSGKYSVKFDGSGLSSGVYFAVLSANGRQYSQRLVLIK